MYQVLTAFIEVSTMPRGMQLVRRQGKIPDLDVEAVASRLHSHMTELNTYADKIEFLDPLHYKSANRYEKRRRAHFPSLASKSRLLTCIITSTKDCSGTCTWDALRQVFENVLRSTNLTLPFGGRADVASLLATKIGMMISDIRFFASNESRWHGRSKDADSGDRVLVQQLIDLIDSGLSDKARVPSISFSETSTGEAALLDSAAFLSLLDKAPEPPLEQRQLENSTPRKRLQFELPFGYTPQKAKKITPPLSPPPGTHSHEFPPLDHFAFLDALGNDCSSKSSDRLEQQALTAEILPGCHLRPLGKKVKQGRCCLNSNVGVCKPGFQARGGGEREIEEEREEKVSARFPLQQMHLNVRAFFCEM